MFKDIVNYQSNTCKCKCYIIVNHCVLLSLLLKAMTEPSQNDITHVSMKLHYEDLPTYTWCKTLMLFLHNSTTSMIGYIWFIFVLFCMCFDTRAMPNRKKKKKSNEILLCANIIMWIKIIFKYLNVSNNHQPVIIL